MMREAWKRLVQGWPTKLAAFAVALVVWGGVTSDPTATAQRTLLLPIVVEGLGAERIAVGVPAFVEATVRGPTTRVDRLRAEAFEAILDLSGQVGEFQVGIEISGPEGIAIDALDPGEVIGRVEALARATVPVVAGVFGATEPGVTIRAAITPDSAVVSGRAAVVAQVAAVVVPVPAGEVGSDGGFTEGGYAVDARGRPVDAGVAGGPFTVTWTSERHYLATTLPLTLQPLPAPWAFVAPIPTEVTLLAAPGALAGVVDVSASADLPTEAVAGARYDVPVTWRLPTGAVALATPRVTVTYVPDLDER